MHPSRAIRGHHSALLAGRRIVVGIAGSIAATETPRVIRELIRHGAEVTAVMSPEATRLVTPEAVHFASGRAPVVQLTGDVEHVTLLGPGEGRADLLLIAPATANTISKIAHGIDDTPVTSCASLALGGGVPVLLAPAMHADMARNPAVRENLARLRAWKVGIVEPVSAEGEEKLATPEEIAAAVLHRLARGPFAGRSVVVLGGASRESIDEVRSVTNESSGATAVALATQAYFRGANVELWAAPLEVPVPGWIPVQPWRSVEGLATLARRRRAVLRGAAAVLVPAALADYAPPPRAGKIASRDHPTLTLTLHRTPKLLAELRRLAPPPTRLVGFKLLAGADTVELEGAGRTLLEESGADWIVANHRTSMGSPTTSLLVLDRRGGHWWIRGPKMEVAGKLLDDLGRDLAALAPSPGPDRPSPPARRAAPPGGRRGRRGRSS